MGGYKDIDAEAEADIDADGSGESDGGRYEDVNGGRDKVIYEGKYGGG